MYYYVVNGFPIKISINQKSPLSESRLTEIHCTDNSIRYNVIACKCVCNLSQIRRILSRSSWSWCWSLLFPEDSLHLERRSLSWRSGLRSQSGLWKMRCAKSIFHSGNIVSVFKLDLSALYSCFYRNTIWFSGRKVLHLFMLRFAGISFIFLRILWYISCNYAMFIPL